MAKFNTVALTTTSENGNGTGRVHVRKCTVKSPRSHRGEKQSTEQGEEINKKYKEMLLKGLMQVRMYELVSNIGPSWS